MAPLRAELARAGLGEVQTYIQSGNVIARSDLTQSRVEGLVHDIIKNSFGGDITVVARTAEQFLRAFNQNPFTGVDTSRIYFSLPVAPFEPDILKEFMSIDFSPDDVMVIDSVIYTLYATRLSDSKFNNNSFERKLKAAMTTRNFNTMSKLVEMTSG